MANVLSAEKQNAIIGALAEGSSIRSIERITGVHRDTIMRLGVKVGQGCAILMDTAMRNLPCNRLEMDEIWGFVGKKDRNVREGEDAVGSVWTFCAIDAETKLVPAFKVGNRDVATATAFVQDVANRMAYRVQISTDGLNAYVAAMENAFGGAVDYAQIIKTYGHEEVSNNRRYSAPEFVSSEKKVVAGILAILLGQLGIHKFYLGYKTAGIIMLLVTVLTCGFGGVIIWIIALIEGITYLSKTDEEFVATYVNGKKQWF